MAIRELHDERHIEREKLAEVLEITDLGVTRIENGAERMSAGDLVLVLDAFDISWDDFYARVKRNQDKAEKQML